MSEQPTFEQNMKKLEQIVQQLEQGNVPLEEALKQFQIGIKLSGDLQSTLNNAENKLTKVMNQNNQEEPFDRDQG
ncbi:exodeoxyribonuclease VII small subunit [Nicoliella spurrieriana]|uniref:Exodeoxyribonuclease 7 small subunit n=1 Tax=Nicoliella spurrieriana TaxID=2925830 RepID=A0A976RRX4_9LACO|nr:exodeoxyribonuclease VII small subunit [Nicoliella spurrieriana]UQS86651.1 exodeoxyribonuclease VII small subunit [Nicoliella spurrieriana]